jgi:DNA-binding NtrC family response regulator
LVLHPAILVVNDEFNLRVSTAQIIHEAGYYVGMAENPDEALKLLKSQSFDLVFLDQRLMTGVELALVKEIQHLYPQIPILIFSPYKNSEPPCHSKSRKMVHFLIKPIDPVEILEAIRLLLTRDNRPELSTTH